MNAARRRCSSARPPTDSAASSVKRGRSRLPPAASMRRTASVMSSLAVPNDDAEVLFDQRVQVALAGRPLEHQAVPTWSAIAPNPSRIVRTSAKPACRKRSASPSASGKFVSELGR